MEIKVLRDVLSANDGIASRNQNRLDKHGILTINVMSSPGSGKTSLILQTIRKLKGEARIAVIEGDVASSIDADKVGQQGATAIQINTAGGCHLDANMTENALNLGEHKRVILLSLPEGDDKPYKYPIMFTEADVVLINKIDLLPYLDFDIASFTKTVSGLNPRVKIFQVSCKTGQGLEGWFSWLEEQIKEMKNRRGS